jgi:uncharacterized protein YegJ (DUF2314 family)
MEWHWGPVVAGSAIGFFYTLYSRWRRDRQAPVFGVAEDDPEMREAIARAGDTLPEFVRVLGNPLPGLRDFSLKAFFPDLQEHMWVTDLSFRDGSFAGRLGNTPVGETALQIGDPVTVPADRVTDWKYIQHDVLVGGYTLRVVCRRMDPGEREAFERSLDFRILD